VDSFWFGGSGLGVSLGYKAWAKVGSFGPVVGGACRCCRGIADQCEGFVEVGVAVVAEMAVDHFVIGD
jgi:tRNA U54 and U55 pseudouridine synthase Pus10